MGFVEICRIVVASICEEFVMLSFIFSLFENFFLPQPLFLLLLFVLALALMFVAKIV